MASVVEIPYLSSLLALPGGNITAFLIILIALVIFFAVALNIVLRVLKFAVRKTETSLDDRLIKAFNAHLPIVAILTSLWISLEAVYPDIFIGQYSEFDIYVVLMLGVAGLLSSSIADALLLWYGLELRPQKKMVKEKEIYPFVRNVVRLGIVLLFLVFMLQRLGFDTTAIITGLGIGGLAVALALQDTLANFFAGVHILVDRPFRRGDYIKMDDVEGKVKGIGWRTTRIETLGKDEIIVPNSKLASSVLKNYSHPKDDTGVLYIVGVDYKEDVDKVEKLIAGVLEKVSKRNEHMKEGSYWLRFDSFGEYALNFKFGYLVHGYVNQWGVLKDVNRELFYTFKKNKVKMPIPVRRIIEKGGS